MFASTRWHEGPEWERMLEVYDDVAAKMCSEGHSQLIPTSYGETQVHICGDPTVQPLVFFHGINTNSLMFGDWLFPELSKDYYCIALDTIGDLGRSLPPEGDPKKGPKNDKELADWAVQVLDALKISDSTKVHLLGYSFGCYIAACVAKYYPHRVDKQVYLAPVGVVASVRKLWLAQAISFAILSKLFPTWESLKTWFFSSMMADPACMEKLKYPELRQATDAIGGPQVQVQPIVFETDDLMEITSTHATLCVIGRQESVVDGAVAIENAEKANMKVIVYENAGHMFFCEHPSTKVIKEIQQFLP